MSPTDSYSPLLKRHSRLNQVGMSSGFVFKNNSMANIDFFLFDFRIGCHQPLPAAEHSNHGTG
jgi:hypothetical protein